VWDLIHFALLDWLARDDRIDWSRAVVDSCSIRAVYGGDQTGPNPTDRAKRGSKRHLICDGRCVPLAVRLTGANRNDSQEALALVDAIPPAARRTRATAAAAGLCGRGSRLRRGHNSAQPPKPSHRAFAGHAPHRAREWLGPVALGRRAYLCLVESVPPPARPLRQTGGHPPGLSLARVRADLLAIDAKALGDGLSGSPLRQRPRSLQSA